MPSLANTLVMILAACGLSVAAIVPLASAAEGAPTGAWRTTNECFLAAFLLTEDGRAEAIYVTGERDGSAVWTWDGSTLRITSRTFDLDSFAGRLTNDHIDADYVWHDLDRDELHRQACEFERFLPGTPL
jgi:hypothetical protein